jgi:hypothetical protein
MADAGVDEFRLKLDTSMYNHLGDTLWIDPPIPALRDWVISQDQYIKGLYYDSLHTESLQSGAVSDIHRLLSCTSVAGVR